MQHHESAPISPSDIEQPRSYREAVLNENLWNFLPTQSYPGATQLPISIDLFGRLNTQALGQAFRALVFSHDSLRRSIQIGQDSAESRTRSYQSSLQELYPRKVESVEELVRATAEHLDLSLEIPIRLYVASISPIRHVLFFTVHRIAIDLWSVRAVSREFIRLYLAFCRGESALSALVNRPICPQWTPEDIEAADKLITQPGSDHLSVSHHRHYVTGSTAASRGMSQADGPPVKSIGFRINSFVHKQIATLAEKCHTDIRTIIYAGLACVMYEGGSGPEFTFVSEESSQIIIGLARQPIDPSGKLVLRSFKLFKDLTFHELLSEMTSASSKSTMQSAVLKSVFPLTVQDPNSLLPSPIRPILVVIRKKKEDLLLRFPNSTFRMKSPAAPLFPFHLCLDMLEYCDPFGQAQGIEGRVSYRVGTVRHFFAEKLAADLFATLKAVLSSPHQSLHSCLEARILPNRPSGRSLIQDVPATASTSPPYRPPERLRYLRPTNPTHFMLAEIWQQILNVSRISMQDNFFDLGGKYELVPQLSRQVQATFGEVLQRSIEGDIITISEMTKELVELSNQTICKEISSLENAASPFFLLHGDIDGGGYYVRRLSMRLSPERSIYAINPHRPSGSFPSIEEMAKQCISEIFEIQNQGPFYIAGYCSGGLIAFEMAKQLSNLGYRIGFVGLISTRYRNPSPQDFSLDEKGSHLSPSKRYFDVTSRYAASWYDGELAILSPDRERASESDFEHWKKMARDVRVYSVPGTHNSCVTKWVSSLGDRLNSCLSAARDEELSKTARKE